MNFYGLSIVIVVSLLAILFALRYYYRKKKFQIGEEVLIDDQYEGHVVEVHDETVVVRVELPNHLVSKKED